MGSTSHSSKHKKKRSQKRSKKKIKSSREKTKKPKRRHDSVSSHEEVAASTLSMSCSGSEDDYRSRKRDRSRGRKDRKDLKKRTKRSRSVSESSGGDDFRRLKKRKGSKRSKGSESKKKRPGKRHRRNQSVSPLIERPRSLSPCEGRDDSERKSKRNDLKERKGREKGKERRGSKRSRHRSRSCSPCSLHSESDSYGIEDIVMEENNPKRLKSIIVVLKEREEAEVTESHWDGHKDEIVYEHDDYPSKSNDSNDGVSRREALSYSQDFSSEKPRSLDDPNGKALAMDMRTSEFPGSQMLVGETDAVAVSNVGTEVDDNLNTDRTEGSAMNADLNRVHLATILRQKALENLLKRQGKVLTKTPIGKKGGLDSQVKASLSLHTDLIQQIPCELEGIKSVQNMVKVDDVKRTTDASGSPKGNVARPVSGELGTGHPAAQNKSPGDFRRTKLGLSTTRKEFIGAKNTWRRQLVSEKSSQPTLSAPKQIIIEDSELQLTSKESSLPNLPLPNQTRTDYSKRQLTSPVSSLPDPSGPEEAVAKDSIMAPGSPCVDSEVNAGKVGSLPASEPSTRGQTTTENLTEANEDSQFQQKTMSVMRGGEMVQVSYKVYIPKKAPALARRQLKR